MCHALKVLALQESYGLASYDLLNSVERVFLKKKKNLNIDIGGL